ncbi:methionyl-tRNA formyltransferase [Stakelama saccharophila]|uniref:Methionyl-tRNA formyltransferase n=1 Tax=Stakelama saccharophila TaxID=3075605 RepID=A0ABZ0BBJ8_9SPHN|nr:methionyl-tRNA formyltransferase [Stakelama sp. W311]WNO54218.1 methionyl-tRNA formyltransferase [Stakelama sp. W311]
MNRPDQRMADTITARRDHASVAIVGAVASTEVAIRTAAACEGWRVAMVVTLPPEKAARHSDFRDLSTAGRESAAELLHAERINDTCILDRIAAARPDLVLVVGWSQIFGPDLLRIFEGRVLGYHPAALPRLRGRAAIPWTILNDEPITAGTLFWVDAGIDSGAVFEQRFFHVAPDETAGSLYDKHMDALAAMISSGLARLRRGDAAARDQDEHCATYAAKRSAADGRIDWNRPTAEIDRLIRAVGRPYPGAFTSSRGERIIVWAASRQAGGERHLAAPGQVVARGAHHFDVRTGDGLLRVRNWKNDTGRPPPLHTVLGDG